MNVVEEKIRGQADLNNLNVDDLGSLVVAMLHENLDDPIGSLIFRGQVKKETDELRSVAAEIVEWFEDEYKKEEEKRDENKIS